MKIALVYGFSTALVIALVNSFFFDLYGIEYEFVRTFSGFPPFIILAVGLFFAMKKTKKEVYLNDLNYGQAMYAGIVISAFTALGLGVINFFYYQFMNTSYAEEVIRIAVPEMNKNKFTTLQIAEQVAVIKDTYIPVNQLTGTFIVLLIAGIVFSAVISAVLRTKDTFTEIAKNKE